MSDSITDVKKFQGENERTVTRKIKEDLHGGIG